MFEKIYAQVGEKIRSFINSNQDRIEKAFNDTNDKFDKKIGDLHTGKRIEGVNLDSLEKGSYYAPTSSVKDTISGLPSDLPNAGFRVDVYDNNASAKIQVLKSFSPSNPVTYQRAFNSGSWGQWDNVSGADYVIEYGSNSNGSYEKWASGKLVQRGRTGVMTTTTSTSGNPYSFNMYKTLSFPIPFKEVPTTILNGTVRSTSVTWSTVRDVSSTNISILLLGVVDTSSGEAFYEAIGKWK